MNSSPHQIIHIGACKSGSTTLQRHFFPKFSSTKFHPTGRGCAKNLDLNFLYQLVLSKDKILSKKLYSKAIDYYGIRPNALKKNCSIAQNLESVTSNKIFKDYGENLILSFEKFSMLSDGQGAIEYPSHADKAKRLYSVFPNAKILLIVRDQAEALKSFFYYRKVSDNFHEFIKSEIISEEQHALSLFDYDAIYSGYEKFFKKKNMIVIEFEKLFNFEPHSVEQLCDTFKTNKKAILLYLSSVRAENVSKKTQLTKLDFILPKHLRTRRLLQTNESIEKQFNESNSRLSRKLGLKIFV